MKLDSQLNIFYCLPIPQILDYSFAIQRKCLDCRDWQMNLNTLGIFQCKNKIEKGFQFVFTRLAVAAIQLLRLASHK